MFRCKFLAIGNKKLGQLLHILNVSDNEASNILNPTFTLALTLKIVDEYVIALECRVKSLIIRETHPRNVTKCHINALETVFFEKNDRKSVFDSIKVNKLYYSSNDKH